MLIISADRLCTMESRLDQKEEIRLCVDCWEYARVLDSTRPADCALCGRRLFSRSDISLMLRTRAAATMCMTGLMYSGKACLHYDIF